MKKGDRVKLKEFKSNGILFFSPMMIRMVGAEVVVESVKDNGTFSISLDGESVFYWLQSACDSIQNERYFLFSYVSGHEIGNLRLINTEGCFPSNKFLRDYIRDNLHFNNAVITNIFEFKSEKDYLSFIHE